MGKKDSDGKREPIEVRALYSKGKNDFGRLDIQIGLGGLVRPEAPPVKRKAKVHRFRKRPREEEDYEGDYGAD